MKLWPFANKQQTEPRLGTKSASFLFGAGALTLSQNSYNDYAEDGYGINPTVRRCIDLLATSMASIDITARVTTKGGLKELRPDHPILKLLTKPNPTQTGSQFRIALASYYLIAGNAYALGLGVDPLLAKPKPPLELYLLPPDKMCPVKGAKTLPLAYEYRTVTETIRYPVNQMTGMSAILHQKTFNPTDPLIGLSPMTAAVFNILILNEGSRWNLRLLQNEGRPSGALTVKSADGSAAELTEEQYRRTRDQIDQQFSGSNNAGRPLLLEGGLEWKEMSLSAKDMDHEKNMNKSARDIALVYGVPPMMLGIPGDNTYSNYEQAKLALWTDTVLPLLASMLESLNSWLAPMYGDGVELWYDEDMIPALEPLRKIKADRIEASTTLSINEKRNAMGQDDVAGGDAILVDASKIPLDLMGDMGLAEIGGTVTVPAADA